MLKIDKKVKSDFVENTITASNGQKLKISIPAVSSALAEFVKYTTTLSQMDHDNLSNEQSLDIFNRQHKLLQRVIGKQNYEDIEEFCYENDEHSDTQFLVRVVLDIPEDELKEHEVKIVKK